MEINDPKPRIVRCPKCKGLLNEIQHVPVYRCGLCSAILLGKSFNSEEVSKNFTSNCANDEQNSRDMSVYRQSMPMNKESWSSEGNLTIVLSMNDRLVFKENRKMSISSEKCLFEQSFEDLVSSDQLVCEKVKVGSKDAQDSSSGSESEEFVATKARIFSRMKSETTPFQHNNSENGKQIESGGSSECVEFAANNESASREKNSDHGNFPSQENVVQTSLDQKVNDRKLSGSSCYSEEFNSVDGRVGEECSSELNHVKNPSNSSDANDELDIVISKISKQLQNSKHHQNGKMTMQSANITGRRSRESHQSSSKIPVNFQHNPVYSPANSWQNPMYSHAHNKKTSEQIVKQTRKLYSRPVLGGIGFICCYKCSQLLQIPESFEYTREIHYRLRCGACSGTIVLSVNVETRADSSMTETNKYDGLIGRTSNEASVSTKFE